MHHLLTSTLNLFTYLNHIPNGAWEGLVATLVISPFVNLIKKWRGWQNDKFILLFTTTVCLVAAAANYLLHTPSQDPGVVALQAAVLSFFSTHVYTLLVKPVWSAVSDKFTNQEVANELKSATIPAAGLPLAGTSVSNPNDFSS